MNFLKKCTKCKKEKTLKSFPKDKQKTDGLYSSCKRCHCLENRVNPERTIRRKHNALKLKYGITLDDYRRMLEDQGGRCAICGGLNKCGVGLAVDHDHKTGKVRKLLCLSCNTILGTAYDNVDILRSAIKYLEGYNH